MITNPAPALLCAPTPPSQAHHTTTELEQALRLNAESIRSKSYKFHLPRLRFDRGWTQVEIVGQAAYMQVK
ncbi:hypothetical protein [Glycomyces tenuis]|uniref:hypothetical protein n=1 Tax=Glycomyces tenuis TaxID=58116 RepID=UPI0012DBECEE|nr:hypothetical protein [Glycomyces tenuis]